MQLAHDLAVVDCRLAIERAVSELPSLRLETWVHESDFRANGDLVTYKARNRDGTMEQAEKFVYPDSYLVIVDERRRSGRLLTKARFLLELDNATHAQSRFGREKAAPGLAYLKSPEYKARFGDNSGRWLVVVAAGKVRMRNLMRQTRHVLGVGAGAFLFTTFDELGASNVLIEPIWWQVGQRDPVPLFAEVQKGDL
jgi:hypothetical protein